MRNKLLLIIGIMLFILGQVGVNYLIYKEINDTRIPEVRLKDQEKNSNTFAIMLEQSDGSYKATTSTSFNQPGYMFNNEKSGCIDINGNKIDNALSYNVTNKSIIVGTGSTTYCYVYFDLVALGEGSVSINNNDTYTISTSVTLKLNATNASEMCISNTHSCTNWESYATNKNWTLETGDGTKTVYVTYRNASGEIMEEVRDEIILDTIAPSLTVNQYRENTSLSNPKIIYIANYELNGTVSGATSVTVNGARVDMTELPWDEGSYTWNESITLKQGVTTQIVVVATDNAGNTTTKSWFVKYQSASIIPPGPGTGEVM